MKDMFDDKANIDVCEVKDLPLFNEDDVHELPQSVTTLCRKIEDADGVIIAVPEYDHAVQQIYPKVPLSGYHAQFIPLRTRL